MAAGAIRAISWTTASVLGRSGFAVVQTAILSRLLGPAEFGAIAVLTAILGFGQVLAEFGIGTALIHRTEVPRQERIELYWFAVLSAVVAMLLLWCLGPLVAWMYRDPRMLTCLLGLGLTIPITALAQPIRFWAERDLHFKPITAAELLGGLASLTAAILSALMGFGIYALVIGALANSVLCSCVIFLVLGRRFEVGWPTGFSHVRENLKFGANSVAYALVATASAQSDVLLGGKLLGAGSLGLYTVPRDLCIRLSTTMNSIVTRVTFPMLARSQGDEEELRRVYLSSARFAALANAPFYFFGLGNSKELITFLLGPKWSEASALFACVCAWGYLRALANPAGSLVLALGKLRLALQWSIGTLIAYVAIYTSGLLLGGAFGLAIALISAAVVLIPAQWRLILQPLCRVKLRDYLLVFVPATTAATVALGVSSLLQPGGLVGLIFRFMLFLSCYFFLVLALDRHARGLFRHKLSGN